MNNKVKSYNLGELGKRLNYRIIWKNFKVHTGTFNNMFFNFKFHEIKECFVYQNLSLQIGLFKVAGSHLLVLGKGCAWKAKLSLYSAHIFNCYFA